MRVPGLRRGATADDDPAPGDDAPPARALTGPVAAGRPVAGARPAVPDSAVVADAVRAAVLAVPGVVALHPGAFGAVATYLPGRRVVGVQLRPGAGEVHVVLAVGADILRTVARVHGAAESVVGAPVHVFVEDLVDVEDLAASQP